MTQSRAKYGAHKGGPNHSDRGSFTLPLLVHLPPFPWDIPYDAVLRCAGAEHLRPSALCPGALRLCETERSTDMGVKTTESRKGEMCIRRGVCQRG